MPGRVRELRGSRPATCRAVEAEAGLRSMDASLQEPAAAPGAHNHARLDAFGLSCHAPAAGKPHLQSALHLSMPAAGLLSALCKRCRLCV